MDVELGCPSWMNWQLSCCWLVLNSWLRGQCLCHFVPHNHWKSKLQSTWAALHLLAPPPPYSLLFPWWLFCLLLWVERFGWATHRYLTPLPSIPNKSYVVSVDHKPNIPSKRLNNYEPVCPSSEAIGWQAAGPWFDGFGSPLAYLQKCVHGHWLIVYLFLPQLMKHYNDLHHALPS